MEWRLFVATLSLLLLSSSQTVSEATEGVTIEGYSSTGNISLSDKQPVAEHVLLLCRTPDDHNGTVHNYTWMCNDTQCDSSAGVVRTRGNKIFLILQIYNQTYSCQAGNRTANVTIATTKGVTIEGYSSTGKVSLSDKQPVAEYVLLLCRTLDDDNSTVHNYTWMCNGTQCNSSAGVVRTRGNRLLLILQVYNQTYSCNATGIGTASVTIATNKPVVLTSGGRLYQPGTIFPNLTTLQEHSTPNLRQLLCKEVRGNRRTLDFMLWESPTSSTSVTNDSTGSEGVYQIKNVGERQATLVFNMSHNTDGVYSCQRNGDRFIYVFSNTHEHNVNLTNFTNTSTELSFAITPPTNTTIQWVIVGYELIDHGEDLAIPLQNDHMTYDGEKFVYNTTGNLTQGSRYVMKVWVVIDGRIAMRPEEKRFTYLGMPESLPTSTISMAIVPTPTSSTSPIPPVTTSTPQSPPQSTPQSTDDTTPYIAGAAAVVLVILIIVMVIVIVVLATAIHRTNKEVKDGFAVQYSQEPGNGTDNAPDQPGGESNYEEPKIGKGALVELKPSESPNSQTSGLPTGEQREGGNTGKDHYDEINDGVGYYDAPITTASVDNLVTSSTGKYDTPDCLTTVITNTHTEGVRVVRTKSDGAGILEELKKTQSMEEMYAQPDMTKKTKRRSAPLLDTPDQDVPLSHTNRRSTADNSRMNQQQQQQQQLKGESTSAVREPLYDQVNDAKVGESPPNVLTNEYSVLHSEEEYYNVGEQQQNGHQESTTSDK